jgi:hypothetical protein
MLSSGKTTMGRRRAQALNDPEDTAVVVGQLVPRSGRALIVGTSCGGGN